MSRSNVFGQKHLEKKITVFLFGEVGDTGFFLYVCVCEVGGGDSSHTDNEDATRGLKRG